MNSAARKKALLLVSVSLMLIAVAGCASSQREQASTQTPISTPPTPDAAVTPAPPAETPEEQGSAVLGVFEGITPCSNSAPPAPHIPADATCEMMIWHLTLYHDPETAAPTTYTLNSSYGMSQPNTTGIAGGGTALNLEGTWAAIQGAENNPEAVVYQLNPDQPEQSVYFIKIDDNLLHVLTPEKSLMVGNGGWSYTLNRTDQRIPPDDLAGEPTPLTFTPDGASTLGVFDGRTPCADIVYDFTGFPRDEPNCIKIKWRLTLHQNPETGEPTTYDFKGTQTDGTGTWTALRTERYSDAVIYALTPDTSEQTIFFLKPDANHLYLLDSDLNPMIGDALWSYTLSKKP